MTYDKNKFIALIIIIIGLLTGNVVGLVKNSELKESLGKCLDVVVKEELKNPVKVDQPKPEVKK